MIGCKLRRDAAKVKADELAAALRQPGRTASASLTLAGLFDNYLREKTPTKSPGKQRHDRTTALLVLDILGGSTKVEELTHRDAMRYAQERLRRGDMRQGRTKGDPIGPRQIHYDLSFFRAVLSGAVAAGLLTRNPLQGFRFESKRYTPPRRS